MSRPLNISEAKAQLSRLIASIEATGEPILICRNGHVVAELGRPKGRELVLGDLAARYEGPGPEIRGPDPETLSEWGEA